MTKVCGEVILKMSTMPMTTMPSPMEGTTTSLQAAELQLSGLLTLFLVPSDPTIAPIPTLVSSFSALVKHFVFRYYRAINWTLRPCRELRW